MSHLHRQTLRSIILSNATKQDQDVKMYVVKAFKILYMKFVVQNSAAKFIKHMIYFLKVTLLFGEAIFTYILNFSSSTQSTIAILVIHKHSQVGRPKLRSSLATPDNGGGPKRHE